MCVLNRAAVGRRVNLSDIFAARREIGGGGGKGAGKNINESFSISVSISIFLQFFTFFPSPAQHWIGESITLSSAAPYPPLEDTEQEFGRL